jgi:hypothetical protein
VQLPTGLQQQANGAAGVCRPPYLSTDIWQQNPCNTSVVLPIVKENADGEKNAVWW